MNLQFFRKADFWIGLIGITLSLFLLAQTRSLSGGAVSDAVGAAFFPRLLLGLLLILCVLLILRTRKNAQPDEDGGTVKPAFVTVLAVALYAFAMPFIGYYPSTIVLLAAILWIAGMRKPLSIALVVAVLVGFQFAVFDRVFGVLFPASSLMG